MTEGIMNLDGSRNWQANILLDNVKRLEQENKELKEMYRLSCLKCEYKNTKADVDNYRSALEEIRILATKNVSIENFVKIQNKINEVLNEDK